MNRTLSESEAFIQPEDTPQSFLDNDSPHHCAIFRKPPPDFRLISRLSHRLFVHHSVDIDSTKRPDLYKESLPSGLTTQSSLRASRYNNFVQYPAISPRYNSIYNSPSTINSIYNSPSTNSSPHYFRPCRPAALAALQKKWPISTLTISQT